MKFNIPKYTYSYYFYACWQDKNGANQIMRRMNKWLIDTYDLSEYSVKWRHPKPTDKFRVDFLNETAYTFFVLRWNDVVANYYTSCGVQRTTQYHGHGIIKEY